MSIREIAAAAKSASIRLAAVDTDAKNDALAQIADALKRNSDRIVSANTEDLVAAEQDNLHERIELVAACIEERLPPLDRDTGYGRELRGRLADLEGMRIASVSRRESAKQC